MNEWQTIKTLKDKIMALPDNAQGPLIAELAVLSDKLYGLGVLLEDLENTVTRIEAQTKQPSMVQCCYCQRVFRPNAEKMRLWAESGRQFDPTDWICSECLNMAVGPNQIIYMEKTTKTAEPL